MKPISVPKLDFNTRQMIRADFAEALKTDEAKTALYRRLATQNRVSVKTIQRTVNGR